jgi:peptidoglycan-associated lipoprotein
MSNTIRTLALILAIAAAGAVGCKKKQQVADDQPTEQTPPTKLAEPADKEEGETEPAEGDVRDAILALRRVHFGFDSADLNTDSRAALDEAADKLKDEVEVHLYVQGHADHAGETEYNMTLGERRAKAVSDYLADLGVNRDRLHIVSYGEEKPLAQGETSQAMAKNRRVDFRVMRGEIELVVEEGATVQ